MDADGIGKRTQSAALGIDLHSVKAGSRRRLTTGVCAIVHGRGDAVSGSPWRPQRGIFFVETKGRDCIAHSFLSARIRASGIRRGERGRLFFCHTAAAAIIVILGGFLASFDDNLLHRSNHLKKEESTWQNTIS